MILTWYRVIPMEIFQHENLLHEIFITQKISRSTVLIIIGLEWCWKPLTKQWGRILWSGHQCCQHLLTRNPKIYEENPGKCIGLMGIGSWKKLHLHMLIRYFSCSKILTLGQNLSFWQHWDTSRESTNVHTTERFELHRPKLWLAR